MTSLNGINVGETVELTAAKKATATEVFTDAILQYTNGIQPLKSWKRPMNHSLVK